MGWYVYHLVDPRDGSVFYVGKGKGNRRWDHLAEAKAGKGCNRAKLDRINAIVGAGLVPVPRIVQEFEIEQDALDAEAEAIALLTGLTNIMAGGGKAMTPEAAAAAAEARQERLRERSIVRNAAWLRDWLATIECWPGVTFPGLRGGEQLAAEFVQMVRSIVAAEGTSRLIRG